MVKNQVRAYKSDGTHCSSGNKENIWAGASARGAAQIGLWTHCPCGLQKTPQQGISPELRERKELIFYNLCIPQFWPTESGCLPADHLHKPERAPGTAAPPPEFLLHRAHPEEESSHQTDKKTHKVWQIQMGISFMIKTGRSDKLAVQKTQN